MRYLLVALTGLTLLLASTPALAERPSASQPAQTKVERSVPAAVTGPDGTSRHARGSSDGITFVTPTDAAGNVAPPAGYSYAPSVPQKVALGGGLSVAVTGLPAGSCLRISCNVAVTLKFGPDTPVATADDNDLPASEIERSCLTSGQSAVAFYSTSAGACKVAVVPQSP